MDIVAVRAAIGAAPANVPAVLGKKLTCTAYTPNSVTVPAFFPADVEVKYHDPRNTFNGQPVLEVLARLLTADETNDVGGQQMLDYYLSHPASTSVKAAIEADQTLGGAAKSVFVHDLDAYRLYTIGTQAYYGVTFHIQVLGG